MANSPQFMPTAMKFHYQFNMRDFANIIENLLLTQPQTYKGNVLAMVRMWAHECHRVWRDRLLFQEDTDAYMNFMRAGMKEFPTDYKEEQIFEEPLIYTSFITMCKGHEPNLQPIADMDELKIQLEKKMEEYNENIATMDLVLFNQAMEHIARICRITFLPGGNALLVGVGGSGKQSLSKLAAYILNHEVFRIVVTTNYTLNDLKADMQTLFTKAGVMGNPTLFLLTDSQIASEYFLVYINDILSAGYIPDLFAKDEVDGILGKVRNEAKSLGYLDTPDQLWDFFLNKIKTNLHLGLCFSPVGDTFRVRARRFPGLINETVIDWFHEWPEDALLGVAGRFLAEIEFPSEEAAAAVGQMMANVHLSIGDANKEFKLRERRFNYTTPTSFLELINFYKSLLGSKRDKLQDQINRLEQGLGIMVATTEKVDLLKKELDVKMQDVEIEKEKTNILIEEVGRESNIAEGEETAAKIQEEATMVVANEAQAMKAKADKELEHAIPIMEEAKEAVNCLSNKAIVEFKNYTTPPKDAD
jgi:dynein heavy chain